MNTRQQVLATRKRAGVFPMQDRGLIVVSGADRQRWLNGMISNDVAALEPGTQRSGCYAAVLTAKGSVVADVHVLLRGDSFWLETSRHALPDLIMRLERYVIADDVELLDASDHFERLGIEGPATRSILSAATGRSIDVAPECCAEVSIGGSDVVAAAFGWSGEDAIQLFAPLGQGRAVEAALRAAAGEDLASGTPEALEILRVEAGIPALGPELGEDVLPDEARLDRAISSTKGCYIGQEIVARIRSRGRVNHRLVGLRFDSDPPPSPGTDLVADGRRIGEITSSCVSPSEGAIGLGFVRREHADPGAQLDAGSTRALVSCLPFVTPTATGVQGREGGPA